ncbi:MAG: MarR family transcriptional regulator [Candidatus Marinimicrobia bacterium]|nr:MarR family transcriptional regulator [Candidatus Neomarinimicrobiota bacterium]
MTSIEQSTGFLVVRTARSMKKMLDAKLVEYKITSSQHTVLSALAKDDGLSLSEVGNNVFLDKPAITGLADRLERDGLVKRKRTSNDRRVITLHLTTKGHELLSNIDQLAQKADEDLVNGLSADELMIFRQTLDRIWSNAIVRNSNEV